MEAGPDGDEVMAGAMAESIDSGGALLLGRRTYEDFASVWPNMPGDNPYTEVINSREKYVASTTLKEPLSWNNSRLLKGDVPQAVTRLKEQSGKNITVLGSGELIQSLMQHNLVDRYLLMIHPLVLGTGLRLFKDDGALAALKLVDSKPTTAGVIIATYRPAEPAVANA